MSGYWRERAAQLGARAVLSTDHVEPLDVVTDRHRGVLLPALTAQLRGGERTVLDLGCGIGRLTADLAGAVGGRAIGADPEPVLLAQAPADARTEHRLIDGPLLPLADGEVDVVFTCLVLGGLDDAALAQLGWEVRRVLAPGGLVLLAESVSTRPAVGHWTFRTVAAYRAAFPWAGLRAVASFDDAGDAVSVLSGRETVDLPTVRVSGARDVEQPHR